jgi:hypothetical protein
LAISGDHFLARAWQQISHLRGITLHTFVVNKPVAAFQTVILVAKKTCSGISTPILRGQPHPAHPYLQALLARTFKSRWHQNVRSNGQPTIQSNQPFRETNHSGPLRIQPSTAANIQRHQTLFSGIQTFIQSVNNALGNKNFSGIEHSYFKQAI